MPDIITNLEFCIALIESARTPEAAFACFCQILERCGYDRITYSLVTDHPSLGLPKQHCIATSYPAGRVANTRFHDPMQVDAIVSQIHLTKKAFFWDDVVTRPDLPSESRVLMKQVEVAWLYNGIGFSLSGISGELAGIRLARTEATLNKKDYDFLARAYLLATVFHDTYRDMLIRQHSEVPPVTVREHDVLLWAAEGKTDQEIAIILGISFHTIRFHWRQVFRKLEVRGRSYAVTKAIRLGLVTPEIIRVPAKSGSNENENN